MKFSSNNVIKIKDKKHKCPTCKKNTIELYFPFCSKKCSDIDLMKWLSDEKNIIKKDSKI